MYVDKVSFRHPIVLRKGPNEKIIKGGQKCKVFWTTETITQESEVL